MLLEGNIKMLTSCHQYPSSRAQVSTMDGTISKRLHKELTKVDNSTIENMLNDSEMAVLDERKLLFLRGNGVQWNPADENCMVADVFFEDSSNSANWSISGEIYETKISS